MSTGVRWNPASVMSDAPRTTPFLSEAWLPLPLPPRESLRTSPWTARATGAPGAPGPRAVAAGRRTPFAAAGLQAGVRKGVTYVEGEFDPASIAVPRGRRPRRG